jgi:hypothetical protein
MVNDEEFFKGVGDRRDCSGDWIKGGMLFLNIERIEVVSDFAIRDKETGVRG